MGLSRGWILFAVLVLLCKHAYGLLSSALSVESLRSPQWIPKPQRQPQQQRTTLPPEVSIEGSWGASWLVVHSGKRRPPLAMRRDGTSTRLYLHLPAAKNVFSSHPRVTWTVSLALWVSLLGYSWTCREGGFRNFGTWMAIHDFHAYTLLILSGFSLFYGNNAVFSEAIPTCFTMSYFLVDLVDCLVRKDGIFVIHALLALGICGGCYLSPLHHNVLRTVSQGAWVEVSTVALHRWYTTQSKRDYSIYFVLFTICRILWIPRLLYQVYRMTPLQSTANKFLRRALWTAGVGLYLLQLAWYANMIKVLRQYDKHMERGMKSHDERPARLIDSEKEEEDEVQAKIDLLFHRPHGHSSDGNGGVTKQ